MGMFDSLFATREDHSHDAEWQTKAYRCELEAYSVGDELPFIEGTKDLTDYQVAVLGGGRGEWIDSLATVRGDVLVEVPAERDPSLPRVDYFGNIVEQAQR